MSRIFDLEHRGIYPDLLRKFVEKGHRVSVVAPAERRFKEATNFKNMGNYDVLRVKVGNLQKTNVIEKGISTVLLESQFLRAIKKYHKNNKFDLIIYSTPPITFGKVIKYIKKRDNAKSYLLLKDIFPQNAVDIGMMSKTGVKGLIYRYFRKVEKGLYSISDYIGCMSQANVDYILKHNPEIDKTCVHISPNSVEVDEKIIMPQKKAEIREKYSIPSDKTVFIYGGNLGKPQDISFVAECLKANASADDRFFVICGTGTEYPKLKAFVDKEKPKNVLLINGLPKEEYEDFVSACDVGLIFLDHRFTIPNFPSRILSYMQKRMPVLACTDKNTDMGKIIVNGGFGWWCESNDVSAFTKTVDEAVKASVSEMREASYNYLLGNYTTDKSYEAIMQNIN